MQIRSVLLTAVLCLSTLSAEEKSSGAIGIDMNLGIRVDEHQTLIRPKLAVEPYMRFVNAEVVDFGLAGLFSPEFYVLAIDDPNVSNSGFSMPLDIGPKVAVTPGVVGGEVSAGMSLLFSHWKYTNDLLDEVIRHNRFQFGFNVSAGPVLTIVKFRFRSLFRYRLLFLTAWGAEGPGSAPNSYDSETFEMRLEPSVLLGPVSVRGGCTFYKRLSRSGGGEFTDWALRNTEFRPFVGILVGQ